MIRIEEKWRLARLVRNIEEGLTDEQDLTFILEFLESELDIGEEEIREIIDRNYDDLDHMVGMWDGLGLPLEE